MYQSLAIGDAKLQIQTLGQGKPLIFLHAGVADLRMWQPQFEALQHRYQLIAYDRRGFGTSHNGVTEFSQQQDLLAIYQHFDISQAALIGSSQGAAVALSFALANMHRVSCLGLLSPAVFGAPGMTLDDAQIQHKLDAIDEAEEAGELSLVNDLEADIWLEGPTSQRGRTGAQLRDLFLQMNGIALAAAEIENEIPSPPSYQHLSDITLPSLLLYGSLDFVHVQQRCIAMADALPQSELVGISDAAHLLNLEYPQRVNEVLLSFLQRCGY